MIFFYGEGRLGNQVFQFQALSSLCNRAAVSNRNLERVLAIGLEDLDSLFDLRERPVKVVTRSGLVKRIAKYFVIPLLLRPLAKWLRLIGYAYEPRTGQGPYRGLSGELMRKAGLFNRLTFVDGGYYQNPQMSHAAFPIDTLSVKAHWVAAARAYLQSSVPSECEAIAVHVRRGDYLQFATYGVNNLALPQDYYWRAIRDVQQQVPNAYFIFVTDDAEWVSTTFADLPNKRTVATSVAADFAVMTQCRGAIVSNSTFSLAAALLIDSPTVVVGPKYWFGFRVGVWLPPKIECKRAPMNYVPVTAEATT